MVEDWGVSTFPSIDNASARAAGLFFTGRGTEPRTWSQIVDILQFEEIIMSRVQALERGVEELSSEELAAFRSWFAAFDAAAWDAQFEGDVAAGRLDHLAEKALSAGETTEL